MKVVSVKVSDTSVARVNPSMSFGACGQLCLKNCSFLDRVDVQEEV